MHVTSRLFTSVSAAIMSKPNSIKQLWIVRHGQAAHNPRAEAARELGCSHEVFMEIMRQDDELDAPLTALGKQQALKLYELHSWQHLELIVSSPLSRALETGDVIVPPDDTIQRVCVEDFREINGWLLNAKRRDRTELQQLFPAWDFDLIASTDNLWTEELEEKEDCALRGYNGLCWLMNRPEDNILLICHGGTLRFTMENSHVRVVDGRTSATSARSDVKARFGNCELRRYELAWDEKNEEGSIPSVVLTEVDL